MLEPVLVVALWKVLACLRATAFLAVGRRIDSRRGLQQQQPQSDERIASIITTAAKGDLWPEAMDLLSQLSDEQYMRVINISGSVPPKTLDKMIAARIAADEGLWRDLRLVHLAKGLL